MGFGILFEHSVFEVCLYGNSEFETCISRNSAFTVMMNPVLARLRCLYWQGLRPTKVSLDLDGGKLCIALANNSPNDESTIVIPDHWVGDRWVHAAAGTGIGLVALNNFFERAGNPQKARRKFLAGRSPDRAALKQTVAPAIVFDNAPARRFTAWINA